MYDDLSKNTLGLKELKKKKAIMTLPHLTLIVVKWNSFEEKCAVIY